MYSIVERLPLTPRSEFTSDELTLGIGDPGGDMKILTMKEFPILQLLSAEAVERAECRARDRVFCCWSYSRAYCFASVTRLLITQLLDWRRPFDGRSSQYSLPGHYLWSYIALPASTISEEITKSMLPNFGRGLLE